MRKYKATGCARFFVVLLFLAPLAYAGAALYNGQNPIEQVKGLLGIDDSIEPANENALILDPADNEKEVTKTPPPKESGAAEQVIALEKENSTLKSENAELKTRIGALEKEIEQLKAPDEDPGGQ